MTSKSIQPNPVKMEMFCTGRDSLKNGEPPALKNGERTENERAHGIRCSNRTVDRIVTNLPPLESPRAGDDQALVERPLKPRTGRAPRVKARAIRPVRIDRRRNECRRRCIVDDDDDDAIAIAAAVLLCWILWHYGHHYVVLGTPSTLPRLRYAQPRTKEFCSLILDLRTLSKAVFQQYNGDDRQREQPDHLHLRGSREKIYCTKRTVQDELLQYGMQYTIWSIAMNAISVCDIFFDSNPLTLNGRGVTHGIRIQTVRDAYSEICSGIWKGIHYGSVLVRYGERRVIPSDTL